MPRVSLLTKHNTAFTLTSASASDPGGHRNLALPWPAESFAAEFTQVLLMGDFMRRHRLITAGIAGTAIVLATATTALAGPASAGAPSIRAAAVAAAPAPDLLPAAAPPAAGGTPTATNDFAPGSGVAAPASVITCTVNVQNPHKSTHVPSTINEIATIACTGSMSELAQYVGLYHNNVLVGEKYNSNTGSPVLTGNFATACSSGTWMGASSWLEVPPPGYYPPYSKGVSYSTIVTITC